MANYAQAVNVIGAIKTSKTEAVLAATGLVLKLYREHFGVIPLEVSGAPEPLFAAAALSEDGRILTLSLVNATEHEIKVPVEFHGLEVGGRGTAFLLTGPGPMAYNEPGKAPQVTIAQKELERKNAKLELPPLSASLFRFDVKR